MKLDYCKNCKFITYRMDYCLLGSMRHGYCKLVNNKKHKPKCITKIKDCKNKKLGGVMKYKLKYNR